MNSFLPDWMFAAFAIGGWELFQLGTTKLHWPWCVYAGYGVVGVCLAVLAVRYVARWVAHRRNPSAEDPDAWKSY